MVKRQAQILIEIKGQVLAILRMKIEYMLQWSATPLQNDTDQSEHN